MELVNSTRMVAGYTMGLEPSGRELLVVVVKGTFVIPKNGEALRLADEQLPLVMVDTFTGEPGVSAPADEIDFAPRKRRCDVLFKGRAYTPGRRPAARVEVGLRANEMTKTFAVVGNRYWQSGLRGVTVSSPEPFSVLPISYDCAFGGVDKNHIDSANHATFHRNPVGKGFHIQLRHEWLAGRPLPNTEELNRTITQPNGSYLPMSLGPLGRNWEPRCKYAGTYDQKWTDEQFPFLPTDFDDRYFQAAGHDQQIAFPAGEIEIALQNLTPDGARAFQIPAFDAPVHFFLKRGGHERGSMALDTIVIDCVQERISLTWRATRALKRDIFEIPTTLVGHKSPAWWRAIESGKTYYSSLAEMVKFSEPE